jgi:hypothetical protein
MDEHANITLRREVYQAYWDTHPRDRAWSRWRISQEHWDAMAGEVVQHIVIGSQLWLMGNPVEIRPGPAEFVREQEE